MDSKISKIMSKVARIGMELLMILETKRLQNITPYGVMLKWID